MARSHALIELLRLGVARRVQVESDGAAHAWFTAPAASDFTIHRHDDAIEVELETADDQDDAISLSVYAEGKVLVSLDGHLRDAGDGEVHIERLF